MALIGNNKTRIYTVLLVNKNLRWPSKKC